DVIKVEEPGAGDYMRWTPPLAGGQSALFNAINRNKRSVTLNLKADAGRDLLLRLVEGADVLVEGNRPGVMDRLGLGWEAVHARKHGGYYSVAALEPKFWSALCSALERPDLVDLQYSDDSVVHVALEEMFASRTRLEWQRRLSALDACCEPVLDIDEVPSHPQIAARRLIETHETGVEVRPAIRLSEGWRRRDAPRLGEHSKEVLAELGIDD